MSHFFWDPPREIFSYNLPLVNRPILWYGFLFALGFYLGYWVLTFLLRSFISEKKRAQYLAERITLFITIGTVVGARLGDVLFYQSWETLVHDPLLVLRVWEGGLASHGGAVGIFLSIVFCVRKYRKEFTFLNFRRVLDLVVIPAALAGAMIRLGNFVNQEILGKPTTVPWAIIFGHPADGSAVVPRHPAQLYEAAFCLVLFGLLLSLWKRWNSLPGKISGLFLVLLFSFRFLVEFVKEHQSEVLSHSFPLDMGQLLSIPFVIVGFVLFRKASDSRNLNEDVLGKS